MRWQYKVIPVEKIAKSPWYWGVRGERYAENIQEALNSMDEDGWEFVDSVLAGVSVGFLVFRKPRANAPADHSTAIKEL